MLEFLAHYIINFIENTMPFSGFLATQGKLSFWWVVVVGTIANLVGSLGTYYLGFLLEETILLRVLRK